MEKTLDLLDKIQFGPHVLKVTSTYGSGRDDPESMITATCTETCCSVPHKIKITMPARELLLLAEEYTNKVGTMQMKSEISRMMANFREQEQKNPKESLPEIPLNVQIESPFSRRLSKIEGIDY